MDSNTRIINLNATSYFGLRHGLETLSQLWEFDDVNRRFLILEQFNIEDRPEFKHRGVMLDSARNFIPLDVIRRVIDGMSFNKVYSIPIGYYLLTYLFYSMLCFISLTVKCTPLAYY